MQPRCAKVCVDQQNPAICLTDDGTDKIGGDERLTFSLNAASDKHTPQRSSSGDLI
jgi:hypothetical protein